MHWGWTLRWSAGCCVVLTASCGKTLHDDGAPARGGATGADAAAGETSAGETSAGETSAGGTNAGGTNAGGTNAGEGGATLAGGMPQAGGGEATVAGANNGSGGDADQAVTYFDPNDSANWSELELSALAQADGLLTMQYDGAAFDGRFAYFAPEPYQTDQAVLRYDTQAPFSDVHSWQRFSGINVLGGGDGERGAVFAGGFVYMAPHHNDEAFGNDVAVRFTPGDFGERIETQRASEVPSSNPAGEFAGVVYDGRYVTFVPGVARFNRLARYDTRLPFTAPASWERSAPDQVQGGPWMGGFCDGRYVYLSPSYVGKIVQIDTQRRLAEPEAYRYYDNGETSGAVFDGRYAYFASKTELSLSRFDTQQDFLAAASWRQIHIQRSPDAPAFHLTRPGAFDGRYLYLFGDTQLVRLDTQGDPDLPDAWRTQNLDIAASACAAAAAYPCVTSSVFDGEYLNIVSGKHYRRLHVRSPKLAPLPNGGSFF